MNIISDLSSLSIMNNISDQCLVYQCQNQKPLYLLYARILLLSNLILTKNVG